MLNLIQTHWVRTSGWKFASRPVRRTTVQRVRMLTGSPWWKCVYQLNLMYFSFHNELVGSGENLCNFVNTLLLFILFSIAFIIHRCFLTQIIMLILTYAFTYISVILCIPNWLSKMRIFVLHWKLSPVFIFEAISCSLLGPIFFYLLPFKIIISLLVEGRWYWGIAHTYNPSYLAGRVGAAWFQG
jgi:hypothetical protein